MLNSALKSIQKEGLDKPFPLKYAVNENKKNQKFIAIEFFAKNYERNTIWMHMGPLYVSLVKTVNPKLLNKYKSQYKKIIEKHKNYLELFNHKGKPYKTPFYYSDEAMSWAVNYLTL